MTTSTDVRVDSRVFDQVPTYRRIITTCIVDEPDQGASTVADALADACGRARRDLAEVDVLTLPQIAAWRDAFRNVGINPSKFRPALEALLRRAARGDSVALGATLVDLGTAVSLSTGVAVGMHAVDDLPPGTGLELRPANGTEKFTAFDGTTELPDAGELIYASGNTVLTRRWAWRQGAVGSMRPGSTHLAINLDVVAEIAVEPAVSVLGDLLVACGAQGLRTFMLDSEAPTVTVIWSGVPNDR